MIVVPILGNEGEGRSSQMNLANEIALGRFLLRLGRGQS